MERSKYSALFIFKYYAILILSGTVPDKKRKKRFMARKTIVLSTDNIYHVINRGVEKRDIFMCNNDYYRFIHDLYEFNDEDVVAQDFRAILSGTVPDKIAPGSTSEYKKRKKVEPKKRKLLVDILAFCLMPNHFHLLLRQRKDGGISLFMRKLGGYVVYFNKKYERVGSLFQNRYKAIDIQTDQQLVTIFSYIHTNPVELREVLWKTSGLRNFKEAKRKLSAWKWSSYPDYIGKKNFPSVTNRKLFLELFGGEDGCKEAVEDWMQHKAQAYEDWKDIALD